MVERSVGIRRIAVVCTVALPLVFFGIALAVEHMGYPARGEILLILAFISLFLPLATYKVGDWIADGFKHKESKDSH